MPSDHDVPAAVSPDTRLDLVGAPAGVDTQHTTAARLYSYFLNPTEGRYWPIDREVAEELRTACPEVPDIAHNNRIFVRRAARYMVENGIRQIIDLGSGLPADENTHEIAQEVNDSVRVVYVDKDPATVAHARTLLVNTSGVTFLGEDVRNVTAVLGHPSTRQLIDVEEPVGFVMGSVLQLFDQLCDTHRMVDRYLDAAPAGSYLALSHFTTEGPHQERIQPLLDVMAAAGEPLTFRSPDEIAAYFDGLEIVEPYEGGGKRQLVWCNRWGSRDPGSAHPSGSWLLAAVARKP